MSANNCIKLPIKTLEIDKFVKMFCNEMSTFFDRLNKSKNYNKNVNGMKDVLKLSQNQVSKKQMKDVKILKSILKQRDILDEVVHHRNTLFLKKIKKEGVKVSTDNTYKVVKKNTLPKHKWRATKYDVLKKGTKMYFSINIDLEKHHYENHQKRITLLENTNILHKIKFYKKLNGINFIPKIVEVLLVLDKKNRITGIKIISDFIKGTTLAKHIKTKKMSEEKKLLLKKNILDKFKVLKKKGIDYGSYNMGQDIIIDNNGKIFLTGIDYLNNVKYFSNANELEYVFNDKYWSKSSFGYDDLIIHQLFNKKKLVFKKSK